MAISGGGIQGGALDVDSTPITRGTAGSALIVNSTGKILTTATRREQLTADRNYFVRTNGNDSNTGLLNTAGGAFLTLQHAWDVIAYTLDLNNHNILVQVADGTYAGGLLAGPTPPGCATTQSIIFQGNTTTPANCLISTAGNCFQHGDAFSGAELGGITIKGFKLASTNAGGIFSTGNLNFENMDFGACPNGNHIYGAHNAFIVTSTPYTVSGNAFFHALAQTGAVLGLHATTVTYTGTPGFFVNYYAQNGGQLFVGGITFVNGGVVTGQRFNVNTGGMIVIDGTNNITYLPGSSAGGIGTDGLYDSFPTGGYIDVSGGLLDANYTVTTLESLIEVLTITATRTLNLPVVTTFPNGRIFTVIDMSGNVNNTTRKITATPNGTDLINNVNAAIDLITTAYGSAQLLSSGGGWFKLR